MRFLSIRCPKLVSVLKHYLWVRWISRRIWLRKDRPSNRISHWVSLQVPTKGRNRMKEISPNTVITPTCRHNIAAMHPKLMCVNLSTLSQCLWATTLTTLQLNLGHQSIITTRLTTCLKDQLQKHWQLLGLKTNINLRQIWFLLKDKEEDLKMCSKITCQVWKI